MARRTPEEVLAQREAWLARKAAREAGQDIPFQRPLKLGEVTKALTESEVIEASVEEESAEPAVTEMPAVPNPETAEQPDDTSPALSPQTPQRKRNPVEIRAQREAFLAARTAKAARQAPPTPKPIETSEPPPPTPVPMSKAASSASKPTPKNQDTIVPVDPNITRRELLNYGWLASIGLLAVETVGLSLWFAFPNFGAGQFGGQFDIGPATDVLPETNAPPIPHTDGKYWLANLDTEAANGEPRKGIVALFNVCIHLGCLYAWVDVTDRFECPCHGSKFELTGDYIEGPARRSLDRFVIRAIAPDGTVKETDAEGNPLVISGDETLVIDTGQRILGKSNA
jgi:cytochrome b6-f complex iron-sulfur subunit